MAESRRNSLIICGYCENICSDESYLRCVECERCFHTTVDCCKLEENIVKAAQSYSWTCNDCKRCEECENQGNDDNMILCDWCDRGFHTHCLKPALSSIPKCEWKCPFCKFDGSSNVEEGDEKVSSVNKTPRSVRRKRNLDAVRVRSPSFSSASVAGDDGGGNQSSKKRRRRNYSEFYNVSHNRPKSTSPPITLTMEKVDNMVKISNETCPVEGCNGEGHLSGKYSHHSFREACPIYHNLHSSNCQSSNEKHFLSKQIKQEDDHYNLRSPTKDQRSQINSIEIEREDFDKNLRKKINKNSSNLIEILSFLDRSVQPILDDFAISHDLDMFKKAQATLADEMEKHPEMRTKESNKIKFVQIGGYEIETFYPSPYPDDVARFEKLYLCEFCLKYTKTSTLLKSHAAKCTLSHPPGKEIYKKGVLSVYEVDGSTNKIFCQNLCLLAKLFLDHKTLYYDVEPFLFYILTESDDEGCHIVGYFSKEKQSVMNCNLSCLLTLPPYQRRGYGRMLIEFSYLLSRLEDKIGSPEHPLSDMGLIAYRGFWKEKILEYMVTREDSTSFSVKDLSQRTGIHVNDLISTLQFYGLVKYWRGEYWILKNKEFIEKNRKTNRKKVTVKRVDPSCMHWPSAKQENLLTN